MNEILKGARYTFGGLVVMTAWSLAMMQVAQWNMDFQDNHQTAEQVASDDALLRFGPGANASQSVVERYFELLVEKELKE